MVTCDRKWHNIWDWHTWNITVTRLTNVTNLMRQSEKETEGDWTKWNTTVDVSLCVLG